MHRSFAVALFALVIASPIIAAEPNTAPEKLLSPSTQLYVRWDGVAAHNEAYKKSVWGPVMAGPTGDSVRALIAKVPKLLGNTLLAEPLLDGKPPAELKANLADLKHVAGIVDLIADKGVIVGAEIREPRPTLKGLGQAVGGLFGGKGPPPDALVPDVQVLAIVPDVGNKAEAFFAAFRLAMKQTEEKIEPFTVGDRRGFKLVPQQRELERPSPFTLQLAWWKEGNHFVLYAGTMRLETVLAEITENAKAGGVTGHPLFQRIQKDPGFESVARGFADAGRIVGLVKSLAGPFIPGLSQRIDDLGLGNVKAVVFNSGFDGKESRAIWEIDVPGERKGFAKVLKSQPLGLNDLPPMPPDVSRFSALRVDATATYEAIIAAVETGLLNEDFGPDDEVKNPADRIRGRREFLAREFDKITGLNMKEDVLPALGDKIVMYQSPTEGLSVFGTVVCVSLKDPAKAKAIADRIHGGIETIISSPVKVRKKTLKGVEIRELYSRNFGFVTPTYAVVGDWLVVSLYPQAVQGFVLRAKSDLPSWKPDAATAARLAKLPADGCGLQYCDPRSTTQNLCCIGPLFVGFLIAQGAFRDRENESDYDPFDVGLIPNGLELSKHLFPNLTVTRDDGKTIRIEVNESFSLPLEFLGLEPVIVGFAFAGFVF